VPGNCCTEVAALWLLMCAFPVEPPSIGTVRMCTIIHCGHPNRRFVLARGWTVAWNA
jgi:hypothetical protein